MMKYIFLCISIYFLFTQTVFSNEFVLNCTMIDSTEYKDPKNEWEKRDNNSVAGITEKFIFDTLNKSVYYEDSLNEDWEVLSTEYGFFFSQHDIRESKIKKEYSLHYQTFNLNTATSILIRTVGITDDKRRRVGMAKTLTWNFIYSCKY